MVSSERNAGIASQCLLGVGRSENGGVDGVRGEVVVTLDDDGAVGLGENDAIERCLDHGDWLINRNREGRDGRWRSVG